VKAHLSSAEISGHYNTLHSRHIPALAFVVEAKNKEEIKHELENVAIANALQLKGRPTLRQSIPALITTPMPNLKSLSLSFAVL